MPKMYFLAFHARDDDGKVGTPIEARVESGEVAFDLRGKRYRPLCNSVRESVARERVSLNLVGNVAVILSSLFCGCSRGATLC